MRRVGLTRAGLAERNWKYWAIPNVCYMHHPPTGKQFTLFWDERYMDVALYTQARAKTTEFTTTQHGNNRVV